MDGSDRYIEEYSSAGTAAEDALLAELERATNLRAIQPKMVSGRVQGAFLQLITKMLRPRLVLEIGTFTGYSALSIAAGLEECENRPQDGAADAPQLHTVEIDDELEDFARSFFERSLHGGKIRLHIGSALDVVPKLARDLGRPFDLVFIDGDKREYPAYYRMLMGDGAPAMVRSGSVILSDNVLWYGKVAREARDAKIDKHTAGIMEFNRMVAADPRVENVILSLRDGINLIRVK